MVEDRVLALESVSEGARFWVVVFLEGGVSSPNPDATDGWNHNSARVPYLDSYSPTFSCDPKFNWDHKYLSNRI
jgi:hypothetical protein